MEHCETKMANASGSWISPSSRGGWIRVGELGSGDVEVTDDGAVAGTVI